MRIDHIALWTNDLEKVKDFYIRYFQGQADSLYHNPNTDFKSYFISFPHAPGMRGDDTPGARLEIMQKPFIPQNLNSVDDQFIGLVHLAFSVGSEQQVDELTVRLQADGYRMVSAPRRTGDGYYESCILDPDGNRVEIAA
jgi:lactoylglutathione lyase